VVEQPVTITRVDGATMGTVTYTVEDNVVVHPMPSGAEAVWPHLLTAYETLGIEVQQQDPRTHQVAVDELRVRRRMGETRLSEYLRCGSSITGEIADQATVTLRMVSSLHPAAEGASELRTWIQATAIPVGAGGFEARSCTSSHQLEFEIAQAVLSGLAGVGGA
jgi:hypothetical protein